MSSQDTTGETLANEAAENADRNDGDDSLASKLSKELSNWRRRRTTARSTRHDDGPSTNYQSDSARTIKVRGHETLVIRKPKLSAKPQARPEDKGDQQ